jgi:predicted nuclease of predicted toxin-antitoxin system
MKFLVDAQLPYLLTIWLREKGFQSIHTDDLTAKDETEDREIRFFADSENYIVITKDSDFLDSYLLNKSPKKMLMVTTGNIKNRNLLDLFRLNFRELVRLFEFYDLIEMNNTQIICHD